MWGFVANKKHSSERVVVAYTASTAAEAMVVRGLLESSGIHSPSFEAANPFPTNESHEGMHGAEVYVLESEAAEARRIIAEHLRENTSSGSGE